MSASELETGMAHLQAGRWEQGIERLRAVLARQPAFAEVWSNLAFALREVGRTDQAREALDSALALKPGLADAWNLLGLVEHDAGRFAEGKRHFDRAIELRPDFTYAWMNRANCDQCLGRIDAALEGYARALELAPGSAAVHYNLGHLHQKVTGRLADALAHYREAIRLEPGHSLAHLNLSHVYFLLNRFEEGWPEFAWRPQRELHTAERARLGLRYAIPALDPWPQRLAIRGEQGLGDILFFLRYAQLAAARGTQLSFRGDARLHALLARTGLFSGLIAEPGAPAPDVAEILVGDLPLLFPGAWQPASLPAPLRLSSDAAVREQMAQRLQALGPAPYVALTWRAGERRTGLFDTLFKQVPVAELGRALRDVRATWISVQRVPGAGEREALEQALGAKVHDLSAANGDLDQALAIMDLADEYVGVSNTNTHLRAGLGRPCRVLVPFSPEWRWMAQGASPWFPGMKVYRQQPDGNWSPALEDLKYTIFR